MYIIPAIDIIDGKCVRLTQGDYTQKTVYNENPVAVAQEFERNGIERLHLVDLDGAKSQHIVNHKVLKEISSSTKLKIDFGGGVKTDEDIKLAFDSGAHQITAGSIAVKNQELVMKWLQTYGAEKIILGADVKGEQIAINGWQENSGIDLYGFLEIYIQQGVQYVICTDVAKDGMMNGPAFDLYFKILDRFPDLKLIASGGVSSIEELTLLETMGCYGAIVGKAIYEGKIDLHKLKRR